jgi:hypothetical protein
LTTTGEVPSWSFGPGVHAAGRESMKPKRLFVLMAATQLSVFSGSCGNVDITDPGDPGGCSALVTATVSSGLSPQTDWTPPCAIGGVSIVAIILDQTCQCYMNRQVWAIETRDPDRNTLGPPIRYGILPSGARTVQPAEPLQRGQEYEVTFSARYVALVGNHYEKGTRTLVRVRFTP